MDSRIRHAVEFLRDDGTHKISVKHLSAMLNLSVSRFSHLFKREIGRSPHCYIKELKMRKAKDLLEASFLSVKEICGAVEFSDYSHFVRDFKKIYGMTPDQYRRQFRA